MTKDDIIRIAQEVGMEYDAHNSEVNTAYYDGVSVDELERFASLVAAAEREACAKICDLIGKPNYQR